MAVRNSNADARNGNGPRGILGRFLLWWQRFLSDIVSGIWSPGAPSAGHATPGSAQRPFALRSPAIAWVGGASLLAGAVGTIVLSQAGIARSVAITAAVMSLIWGGLRWALLRFGASGDLKRDPQAIRGAWALGSILWIVGVTPELRGVAWAASALVTWVVLQRLGATKRSAGLSVGIAWGAQALVTIGSWLARNAVVAFLATRG